MAATTLPMERRDARAMLGMDAEVGFVNLSPNDVFLLFAKEVNVAKGLASRPAVPSVAQLQDMNVREVIPCES